MREAVKTPAEQLVELLRAKGFGISMEEAEQLLIAGNFYDDIELSEAPGQILNQTRIMRGYIVNVEYKSISIPEMYSKQEAVARIIGSSINKQEK